MSRHLKKQKKDWILDILTSAPLWPLIFAWYFDRLRTAFAKGAKGMLVYIRRSEPADVLFECLSFVVISFLIFGPPALLAVGIMLAW